jgi:hypothetical protein
VVYVPVAPRRRGFLFVLGLMVACVAGGATVALIASPAVREAIGMLPSPSASSPPATPSPTPSPTPTATPSPTAPPVPGLGDPVRDGTFEFVVLDMACGIEEVSAGPFTRQARGQFCIIEVSVENIGDVPWFFSDIAQYVEAVDGTRENATTRAGLLANEGFDVFANAIDPGDVVTGKLVFDIPAETTLSTIELHDSVFSGGAIVTV